MRPLLLALAFAFAASPAFAQEAQPAGEADARHHFRVGQAHYESGHFVDAAHEFEESYRLSSRPALLHNIYVAYRDAGMAREAADALRRYLAEAENIENRPLLERRLANLERMAANQGSDDAPPSDDPPDTSDPPPPASTGDPAPATGPSEGGGGGGLSPVGFIVAGVGAAALIGAAVTGPLALVAESDLASMCPNDVCPSNVDYEARASDGRALAITTDVLLGVGVAALATGVVLIFVLQEGGDEDTQVAAACAADGCYAAARTRF